MGTVLPVGEARRRLSLKVAVSFGGSSVESNWLLGLAATGWVEKCSDRQTIALHSTPVERSVCISDVNGRARVSAVRYI